VVLSDLQSRLPGTNIYFYRTSHGAEIDFICTYGSKAVAIECKATLSPLVSKGTYFALEDTGIANLFIIAPVDKGWHKSENIFVASLTEAVTLIRKELGI
jgi:predicted AAA+ superfamily ATPase